MQIALVKYNAGNIRSVELALARLGLTPTLADQPEVLQQADAVIFPGVGEASSAMKYLKSHDLDKVLVNLKQPVLGICLGLQLMCKHSDEGDTTGLGIFDTHVRKFDSFDGRLKVPHMGWSITEPLKANLLLSKSAYHYYVHSYYADLCPQTTATCTYGASFSAMLQHDNFFAAQFHPEKSADAGSLLLEQFIDVARTTQKAILS